MHIIRLDDTPSRPLRLVRACAAAVLVGSAFTACGGLGSAPGPTPLPTPAPPLHEGRYFLTFAGPPVLYSVDGSRTAGCEVSGVLTIVGTSIRLTASGASWIGEADDAAGGDVSIRLGPGPLDGSFPAALDGVGVSGTASGVAHDTLLAPVSGPLGDTRVVLGTPAAPATLRGGALRALVSAGRPLAEGVVDGTVVFRDDHGDSSSCASGTVRWTLGPKL